MAAAAAADHFAALRRQESSRDGPRVTRNISEDQVTDLIRGICSPGNPQDKYLMGEHLGGGATGTVYQAKAKSSKACVAIKIINLMRQPRKDLILMELMVMKENHKNLVKFVESYMVGCNLWVVMELLSGGPLTDVVREIRMSEGQIAAVCKEVTELDPGLVASTLSGWSY